MKFGLRTPSFKKSVSARTTGNFKRKLKRSINPYYGKKGMGWISNPKKAMYNKVYNKTTFGIKDVINSTSRKHISKQNSSSTYSFIGIIIALIILVSLWQYILAILVILGLLYFFLKLK
ncbi:hypothetical protein [Liquorilactobacillus cacaonum]|uniref:Phage protein n=1 Tax=Liquorilactobacillus cacaonum DSM 21116 TaxID=1423729 RepID=A0A0R2CJD4_9LACO|nr:hypothetical protein [Liquorilactobacillus cacaonum]KRM91461.1 hypothetical protein FC80_GL000427 [Liquorilactobacillus cacaonum DSM 21116]